MKRTCRIFARTASKTRLGVLLLVCFLAAGQSSNGAPLRSARVSAVIRDVRLLPSNATPRPATVNDHVSLGTAVRTGTESRAELTFADLTVTRLGENTIFSFNEAARELNVTKGAVLVEVPSKAPAAKISTAGVTAGVMGGTALFATGPPVKFMVLEGAGTFYPTGHPERAVTVHAGEMVMMTADGRITQPTKFNVQLVLETSHLIVDFPDLANLPLILDVVNQQLAEQSAGTPNPLPSKNPLDVIDVLTQNVTANPAVATFTATPTPVAFVINNGTTIVTHPTITTNGVTNVGVLYRGSALDGPVSAFAFGSTSAFDIASGFDNEIQGNNQAAVFKFGSLQLAGNPTIDTTNGPNDLGLIAIGGITSGTPGGNITFTGLRGVLLATQNGSINLGFEISFSGFHDLNIYARGASSDLTLGSDINTTKVRLFAERDMFTTSNITTDDLFAVSGRDMQIGGSATAPIQAVTITLNAFHNFTWSGETSDQTALNSSGDVTITAGQTLTILNDLSIVRHNGGISSGLNVNLTAGGDLVAGNLTGGSHGLGVAVDNSVSGNLDTGANITVNTGGNLTVNGTSALSLLVGNNDGGHIGMGGNISVATGGHLTAGSVFALINNGNGGSISSGGNLTFNIGGALTTAGTTAAPGDATFLILNNSTSANATGGFIGSAATISINAANISTGGALDATVDNTGGTIGGNASISMNVSGTASVSNNATFEILGSNGVAKGAAINFNGGNYGVGGTFLGTIDGDGVITFSNASVRADVVKVGVFGTNGTLTIGGGAISANTALNLYAPGRNGTLNFVANVTLSSGTAANLAAKTITIQPSVVVNVAGNGGPGNIFTSNPNYNFTPGPSYIGPPGNPSNGSFGGNGAFDPQPLANAPSFGGAPAPSSSTANAVAQTLSSANVTSSAKVSGGFGGARQKGGEPAVPNGKATGATINVGSSAQLLSMLDAAAPGPGGKITIPASSRTTYSKNSSRINADSRLKADGGTMGVRARTDNPRLLVSARSFAP
jgi:hypothetical protein